MRCLIIHNLASGPHSDEIFTFAHMLSAAGDEIVMRFIGDGMEPEEATADIRTFAQQSGHKVLSQEVLSDGITLSRVQHRPA